MVCLERISLNHCVFLDKASLLSQLTTKQIYDICSKALDGAPGKDKLELLGILDKAGLLNQLTSEQAYDICLKALDGAPLKDKLELLRILGKAGLFSQLTPKQAYDICLKALDGATLKGFFVILPILDKAGLLSRLPSGDAYYVFCNMVLDKVTAEDVAAVADSFKVLIESISPNNFLKLQDKVKGKLQEEPCINQEFYQQCFNMLELEKESVNNLGSRITALFAENGNQEIAVQSQLSRGVSSI